MPMITPQMAGGANICAVLDTLAFSEGTDNGRQVTYCHGYDVIVGGDTFKDFRDHPRVKVYIPRISDYSTAAGRYQLLARYWDAYRKQLNLPVFSPLAQDLVAIQQIRECKAIPLIQAGRIVEALTAMRSRWASLPGAGYGQHEQQISVLLQAYKQAGGSIAA